MHRLVTVAFLGFVLGIALSGSASGQDPAYYTSAEVLQEIQAQVMAHPDRARAVDLTALPGAVRTTENNAIWALKVSDHVAIDEDEPAILIAAQHHARELNTAHIVIAAMDRVLSGYGVDPALTALVDTREIYFVPLVNPDGVDYVWNTDPTWRKNRRDNGDGTFGVDLNRNFPTAWDASCGGSTVTGSNTYRGPAPGSEPEVQTMRAFVDAVRPEIYLDLHSFGQEVLTTYAPCSPFALNVFDFLLVYATDLAGPMTYGIRLPTASGEAPEDHWTVTGALSFLIEVGTSFQPAFPVTVADETRVWPGLERALTTWQPAVRGHARSIFLETPIAADIAITPDPFLNGESRASRARDGRFGVWLPLGTWTLTWSAPGFEPTTRTVTVTSYNDPQDFEIEMVPVLAPATLVKSGSDRIGTTTTLTYTSPDDVGLVTWIALSAASQPGIAVGPRTLPLVADDLLFASASAPALISSNVGVLPPSGSMTASLHIPPIPLLVGLELFAAGISLEAGWPLSVKNWSEAVGIVFSP